MRDVYKRYIVFDFKNISNSVKFNRFVRVHVAVCRNLRIWYDIHSVSCGRNKRHESGHREDSLYEHLLVR